MPHAMYWTGRAMHCLTGVNWCADLTVCFALNLNGRLIVADEGSEVDEAP